MSKFYDGLAEIPCPYCGSLVCLDEEPAYYSDSETNPAVCDECNKEFYVTTHVEYSWSTQRTES